MDLLRRLLSKELELFPVEDGWLPEAPQHSGLYEVYLPENEDVYLVLVCRDQCHVTMNFPLAVQFSTSICKLANNKETLENTVKLEGEYQLIDPIFTGALWKMQKRCPQSKNM